MERIDVRQGSPEWHAHRRAHFNASDAPAMMGCSSYKTRSALITELATGITPEVDEATQKRFDDGHRFEALAREAIAEKIIGEQLAPLVGSEGPYSASYDGLNLFEEMAFEHKTLNARLREAMFDGCAGTDLPLEYQVQMEQQCMVCTTIERVLFVASKWERVHDYREDDPHGWRLVEARHCWYTPNPELRAKIVAGWKLLEQDVAAYDPSSEAQAAKPMPKLQQALPALRIDARGEITASNLDEFQAIAMARINSINTELETDQHFADADADAKWLRDVAAGMKAAVQRVRAGMESVDEVLRVLEHLDALSTQKALDLEKKVKTEKDSRKEKIILAAEADLKTHIDSLNQQMGANYIPLPRGIFAPVVKGLKSLQSMEDKVRAALGSAQAEATAQSHLLALNRDFIRAEGRDWITLFPDFATVGKKDHEDFRALAALRISEHQKAEAERLEREEHERADKEMREKLIQAERDAQAGIAEARATDALPAPLLDDLSNLASDLRADAVSAIDTRQAIGAAQASAAAMDKTITLGQINARLAPIKLDAAGLEAMGFAVTRVKAAVHLPAFRFPALCRAIAQRAMEAAAEPSQTVLA